ncbi:MAG TPA: isocitrate lyase/phosphoenolpyruvate mutase family protein [Candidatus Angelobacter sp.]|nr:isocitrate lyase/phosphoenolpyruvate mutase family protein [Candidatus Angelobacter sp.]
MRSQKDKARDFRALHHGKRILILPNAWDVPSARIFENEGFPAVATSSAGLMVSLGYPDGEVIDRDEFLSAIRRIGRVLSVPFSVDIVAGFGRTTKEVLITVKAILKAGGVGINIEDFAHATKKLDPIEREVENVRAIRKLGDTVGIPLVVNARTDALRFGLGDEDAKFQEAVRRSIAYRDAGADCVYPMGLTEAALIGRFVKELDFPVNVMVRKGLPTVSELDRLGVARVSFGPGASYAALGLLKRAAKEVLERGTYQNLIDDTISFDELNSLVLAQSNPMRGD